MRNCLLQFWFNHTIPLSSSEIVNCVQIILTHCYSRITWLPNITMIHCAVTVHPPTSQILPGIKHFAPIQIGKRFVSYRSQDFIFYSAVSSAFFARSISSSMSAFWLASTPATIFFRSGDLPTTTTVATDFASFG